MDLSPSVLLLCTANVAAACGATEGAMGELLFHYCSTPTAFAILRTRTFRLSSLSSANDSLEGRILGRVFAELLTEGGLPKEAVDVASVIVDGYPDATEGFAFCLSENGDLLSQWRAYGSDARGMAIGFDADVLTSDFGDVNFGSRFTELVRVEYGTEGVRQLLSPIAAAVKTHFDAHGVFAKLNERYTRASAGAALAKIEMGGVTKLFDATRLDAEQRLFELLDILSPLHFKIYRTKAAAFHEEREWRLLRHRHHALHAEVDYFSDETTIRPFIPCLVADPARNAIATIILGPKNRTDTRWLQAFLKSVGLPHVTVSRTSIESYR